MSSSPPIARRQLSAQMRQKRFDAGMTLDDAAAALEWSPTKVSNIETGRSKHPAVSDVRLLLGIYGLTDPREVDAILDLTRQSRQRGWWSRYDDVLTGAYTALESGATSLRLWEMQYVPGLLQLPEYASAVAHATLVRDPEAIERVVEARVQRQRLLARDSGAPEVWAIIDNHVLELLAATDSELHRRQVEHLAALAEAANTVTIQVLQADVGLHPGMGGPFAIMDYGDDPTAAMVFLETDTDGLYLDKKLEVDRYRRIFDRLVSKASDPDNTAAYLRSLKS